MTELNYDTELSVLISEANTAISHAQQIEAGLKMFLVLQREAQDGICCDTDAMVRSLSMTWTFINQLISKLAPDGPIWENVIKIQMGENHGTY